MKTAAKRMIPASFLVPVLILGLGGGVLAADNSMPGMTMPNDPTQGTSIAGATVGTFSTLPSSDPNAQWLDQMSRTMDQMMNLLPGLTQKDPDAALQTMNEMLKVMSQINGVMAENAKENRGMMAQQPTVSAPIPTPAPSTASDPMSGPDPNAGGGGMDSMDKMMMGGMM